MQLVPPKVLLRNDRQITISAAGSRRAAHWPAQTLLWSELVDRLKMPARGAESLPEYLRLPKGKQDDLKDVGGYVAGSLAGGRRKAGAVTGRDAVALDFDAIPAMLTETVLKRLDSLGIGFAVYSTRKHEPARPRLRVLIPLARTVTADEYEPLARKLAEYVGIEMCDPTTFEASRLMYWPSCCNGAEYVFHYADRPFVDADATLALYADWRDVTTWPHVPSEQAHQQRLVAKQEDPTTKTGLVGAFCRSYNIYQAMDTFLPGEYEPVDNSPDRYTFTGGSTTGGAVVYDHGLYLFSHHATDPAGGRLVNAFDLVRLHRYGGLDDEAKEGTPTGKLPSYTEMTKLVQADPAAGTLARQERGAQILEDFAEESQFEGEPGERLAAFLGGLRGAFLTTATVRGLLAALGIRLRLNVITGCAEIEGCPANWSRENAENNLPTMLLDLLRPSEIKGASKNAVCDSLDLIADENRYNPVVDTLPTIQWDTIDRLYDVYAMLGVSDSFERILIRKWLHQCVAMAFNDEREPWAADGVLTLGGEQGMGKTSFVKMLCPFPGLMKEGAVIDPKQKDTLIQALGRWICELGELDRTTSKDHASLKAIITAESDEYRTPYARKAVKRVRRTSFCGTVNTKDFLQDDTGNRRFWSVWLKRIDLPYLFSRSLDWKLQLWGQMYQAFLQNPQGFRLTGEERAVLEARNHKHTKALDYELEIKALFDFGIPEADWPELSATQVSVRIGPHIPANRVGRALGKIALEDSRVQRRMVDGGMRYKLPVKKLPDFA